MFTILIQQIALENKSDHSIFYFLIRFFETFLQNLHREMKEEYIDWNFNLNVDEDRVADKKFERKFSERNLKKSNDANINMCVSSQTEIEISQEDNLFSVMKEFVANKKLFVKWLNVLDEYNHQPQNFSKRIGNSPKIGIMELVDDRGKHSEFIEVESSSTKDTNDDSTNVKESISSVFKNPLSTLPSKKEGELSPIFEEFKKKIENLVKFLIFLNKSLFLIINNNHLIKDFKDKKIKGENFINQLKKTYEEEIQIYIDNCPNKCFNFYLEKLNNFLEMKKYLDKELLKRILDVILFRKFLFIEGKNQ